MKKIEAWKTDDSKVFTKKTEAEKHQNELDTVAAFERVYYNGMIESASDIVSLLIEHKTIILDFYGLC